MERISEEEIKKNWPSAVEGSIEHPELGVVYYWTGEQHGKIVVRFSYDSQAESDSEKIFFIVLNDIGKLTADFQRFIGGIIK